MWECNHHLKAPAKNALAFSLAGCSHFHRAVTDRAIWWSAKEQSLLIRGGEKNIRRQCADYRKIRLSSGKVLCVICIIYSFFTPLFNHHLFFFFSASCGQFPLIFEWIAHLRLLKENDHLAYFNCEQRCEAKLTERGPFKVKGTLVVLWRITSGCTHSPSSSSSSSLESM